MPGAGFASPGSSSSGSRNCHDHAQHCNFPSLSLSRLHFRFSPFSRDPVYIKELTLLLLRHPFLPGNPKAGNVTYKTPTARSCTTPYTLQVVAPATTTNPFSTLHPQHHQNHLKSHPMLSTAACTRTAMPRHAVKALATFTISPSSSSGSLLAASSLHASRCFSTTRPAQLRDFFPAKDTPLIKTTPASWPHPGYTMEEMKAVEVGHRPPRTTADWLAWKTVRLARWCMDTATGMDRDQKVDKKNPTTALDAKPLTEAQWVSYHPSLAFVALPCLAFAVR